MKSKKFILKPEEEKRLTSEVEGGIPNPVGLNLKEDALSKEKETDTERKFPERRSHLCQNRTIEC